MSEVVKVNATNMETVPPDHIMPGSRVRLRFSDDLDVDETYLITDHNFKGDTETSLTPLPITSPLGTKIKHMKAGEKLTLKSAHSGEVEIEILDVDNS